MKLTKTHCSIEWYTHKQNTQTSLALSESITKSCRVSESLGKCLSRRETHMSLPNQTPSPSFSPGERRVWKNCVQSSRDVNTGSHWEERVRV